jgi:hypothetical protein
MRALNRQMHTLVGVLVFQTLHLAAAEPSSAPTPATKPPADAVDIRDEHGNVLIAADKIASYDWSTHTITLVPGERAKFDAMLKKQGTGLNAGVPFAITVGGTTVYTGKITFIGSSFSIAAPVIVMGINITDPKLNADQLRIQLGYPTRQFFRGEDPRGDGRLRAALRASGKLAKAPPEYTQWLADSLREIQSLKPGMTRADLLKTFEEEGGLSTRTERRYAYRDCPCIKVNVKFEPVGSLDDKSTNASADKIRTISQPFLEWPIAD